MKKNTYHLSSSKSSYQVVVADRAHEHSPRGEDPDALRSNKGMMRAARNAVGHEELKSLWETTIGTCTIWAINVAEIDRKPFWAHPRRPGESHRAAWSANGVVLSTPRRLAQLTSATGPSSKGYGNWRVVDLCSRYNSLIFELASLIMY
jgi:hypothetical protein